MNTFLEITLAFIALFSIVGIGISKRRPVTERPPLPNQAELNEKFQRIDELQMLLSKGEKIKAIKLYREETNVGLKEAKQAVEYIEWKMTQEKEDARVTSLSESDPKLEEVRRLLIEKQKINAIKAYRQIADVGLKEAKEAVERMEEGRTQPESQEQINAAEANLVDPETLQRLLREGNKILAIKYYRQQRGVGLKEAKDAVDWLQANIPPQA